MSHFYGKSASVPSISAPGTSNIDTGASSQTGSWELSNLVSDAFGKPLTYVTSSFNSSHFSSASNVGSKLFFGFPLNRFVQSTAATITVINRFGRSNTITPTFTSVGYGIASSSLGLVTLSNNTVTYALGSYFTDYSGTGLGYSLMTNPNGNASISGNTLSVTGNYRASTYYVYVTASNSYNQTATAALSVTETAAPVVFSSSGGTKSTYSTYTLHTFTSSGTFTVNSNVVCYLWIIGGGGGGGSYYCGGGGGAGAANEIGNYTIPAGSYSVTVGSGGSGGLYAGAGANGGTSSISGIASGSGGGGGGGWSPSAGASGGCGGGGGTNGYGAGGGGNLGYGGASGRYNDGGINRGGGGGGMGGPGANTNGNPAGGSGITVNWGGSNIAVCGGGGGGTDNTTYGVGGSGGGGSGGQANYNGSDAWSYGSGGGGAGGGNSSRGGNGSAGIVVIRYTTPAGVSSPYTYTANLPLGDGTPYCSGWTTYCLGLGTFYSTVKMSSSSDTVGRTCTNSTIATNLASNLKAGTAYSAYDSATGFTWCTGSCGSESRTLSATGTTCQCDNPGYTYRPCIGGASGTNWGGIGTNSCGAPAQTVTITFS